MGTLQSNIQIFPMPDIDPLQSIANQPSVSSETTPAATNDQTQQEYQSEVASLVAAEPTEPVLSVEAGVPTEHSERVSYADAVIQEIPVAQISPNPFQPRKVFEPGALK